MRRTSWLPVRKSVCHPNATVEESFARIRKVGMDKETIYTCYVTNHNRVLEGVVTVKELLLSDYDKRIGDIMEENVLFARTSDDKEHIAGMFRKYDLLSLPVVDNEQRLVGIITIDDAVDVMQEENTEDFEKMAALSPSEDTYLKTPSFEMCIRDSGYTDWYFLGLTRFDDMFAETFVLQYVLLSICILIYVGGLFLTIRFIGVIISPLEKLTLRMKQVGQGEFHVSEAALAPRKGKTSEIRSLEFDFDRMVHELSLIHI